MISLFIDTSYSQMVISIFKDKECIYHKQEISNNELSVKLLPAIEEAFSSLKMNVKQVGKIFVVNGPGSFTGVRIGVTVAKTLAWALGIGVVPLSELEFLATSDNKKKYIVPLIDARRGAVYGALYDTTLKSYIEDQYIQLDELLKIVGEKKKLDNIAFVSYDSFDSISVKEPTPNVSKIIEKHWEDSPIPAHILIPNYLKKTEAEEKLEQ